MVASLHACRGESGNEAREKCTHVIASVATAVAVH